MSYDKELLEGARAIREKAYAPYSNFKVGAALKTRDGRVFLGVNVENISYGLTICAERSAVTAAVTAGATDFEELAVVAGTARVTSPCGACRQVLVEFNPKLRVVLANLEKVHRVTTMEELLPCAFDLETFESQKGEA